MNYFTTLGNRMVEWGTVEWMRCFLVALLFAMPVSSTAKSILMGLVVATVVFSPNYRRALSGLVYSPWCKTIFLFIGIAVLGCFWGPALLSEKGLVVEKYSKLLYLPILTVGFQDKKTRQFALYAFLLAMLLTSVLSIIKYWSIIQSNSINADFVFRNHIMTGTMMSFAAYLCGLFFFRQQGRVRIVYLLMGAIFSYQIFFVSTGRTAYVIYLVLVLLLMLQLFSKRQLIAGGFVIVALFTLGYYFSAPMHEGVNKVIADVQHYEENKNTSVGYRIQFHNFAQQLFLRHPWFGNGTGSFTALFRIESPVPSWDRRLLEPHGQYWLVAAEFGVVGLVCLLLMLASFLSASWQLREMKPIAVASLIIFCIGNLSDSLLFYSGSGYFFILFMALCFGENILDARKFRSE